MEHVILHFLTDYKLHQFMESINLSVAEIDYSSNNLYCTLTEPDIEKAIVAFDAEKIEFQTPSG